MALHHITCVVVIVFLGSVWSMPTPHACQLQRNLIETTHRLLETMGGHFPLQCVEENVKISFPATVIESNKQQGTGAAKAVYEVLKSIDALFDNDSIPDQWDATKLDDFQNIVYRQIEESKCIMSKTEESNDDFPARKAAVRIFFDKLSAVLKEKVYSFCAWEIVRKELQYALRSILDDKSNLLWSKN
ncbi:interferon alpha-11-like [Chanos chanos]|uniref:Interferon alpha-11-like n=1 Tax=Chanos chanos TaxID=29144 RepID=A0A6J2X0D2_CHACN|nr:interferon alpha-11-like [Chanos chanos]